MCGRPPETPQRKIGAPRPQTAAEMAGVISRSRGVATSRRAGIHARKPLSGAGAGVSKAILGGKGTNPSLTGARLQQGVQGAAARIVRRSRKRGKKCALLRRARKAQSRDGSIPHQRAALRGDLLGRARGYAIAQTRARPCGLALFRFVGVRIRAVRPRRGRPAWTPGSTTSMSPRPERDKQQRRHQRREHRQRATEVALSAPSALPARPRRPPPVPAGRGAGRRTAPPTRSRHRWRSPSVTLMPLRLARARPACRRSPSGAETAPACRARRSWARRRPDARTRSCQPIARGANIGDLVADVMDAAGRVALQEPGDGRFLAQRLQQLDFRVGQTSRTPP